MYPAAFEIMGPKHAMVTNLNNFGGHGDVIDHVTIRLAMLFTTGGPLESSTVSEIFGPRGAARWAGFAMAHKQILFGWATMHLVPPIIGLCVR